MTSCCEVYQGKAIQILDKVVRLPDGRLAHRDIVTYPGGAVCIVPVTSEGHVILVRQYRPTVETVMLEIPAGRRHPGEHFLSAAKRELREETGYTASSWVRCTEFWPSPGFVDERLTLFIARDLKGGPRDLDSDEFITCVSLPVPAALEQCRNGHITDAKTLLGLLWYAFFEKIATH